MALSDGIGRLKERYSRLARYHALEFDAGARKLVHEPDAEQVELYRLLDVPAELIRPKKTWIHPPHH